MRKIAFCLINYFPFGGLQRDFIRIARECVRRKFEVHVYTTSWEGDVEPGMELHVVPVKGFTNHARAQSFAEQIGQLLSGDDRPLVVGFNKMPHLDLYYAADVCYQARIRASRSCWYRFMPRYRTWVELEAGVFQAGNHTDILLISSLQQPDYEACYGTEPNRFHLLPPGIDRDRLAPPTALQQRESMRKELGLTDSHVLLLMVGSGYQTKGLDRAIEGLASLPSKLRASAQLYVVGKGNARPYLKLAKKLGVEQHVHIMGARKDVPSFLLAADLLCHPSYHENTGTVILEAMAAGLPVLTTAVCGYAHYVTDAQAGMVLPAKFSQATWNAGLEKMLLLPDRQQLGANGLAFATVADIYDMPTHAVNLIEQRARQSDLS